jgi:hypothetical protein
LKSFKGFSELKEKKSKTTFCNINMCNICDALQSYDVPKCEFKRAIQHILDFMKKTFQALLDLVTKEEVMKKVMVDPFIGLVSKSSTIFKHVITKRMLVTMLVQYLSEAKRPYTSTQLITKHVLLIVVMSINSQTLSRQKVWLLNMHPQNFAKVVRCWELMNSVGGFLWSLKEEGKDLTLRTKAIILSWWAYDMQ